MDTAEASGLIIKAVRQEQQQQQQQKKRRIWASIATIVIFIAIAIFLTLFLVLNDIPRRKTIIAKDNGGLFGKWPCYGGNPQNQQITPKAKTVSTGVRINMDNIDQVAHLCTYDHLLNDTSTEAEAEAPMVGYVTVDDENRAYISTANGLVVCFELDACTALWSVNVATAAHITSASASATEADPESTATTTVTVLAMRHTVTLFQNSQGIKGVLVGAPNRRGDTMRNYERRDPCFAIALFASNGSLMWKTNLLPPNTQHKDVTENDNCHAHGFMVDEDDHYAYGGMSMGGTPASLNGTENVFRGKMFKLDIDSGEIVHIWYSISEEHRQHSTAADVSNPYVYRGGSMWHMPAIIGEYLVFGTGNMWTYPRCIEDCLLWLKTGSGNGSAVELEFDLERAYTMDPCGNDRAIPEDSHFSRYWRCLEKGIYADSLVILNKHTFETTAAIPLQGIDAYDSRCADQARGHKAWYCMKEQGPDADVAAVAVYTNPTDEHMYAIAMQKSGHLYVFEVLSGDTVIAKKVGPWSAAGGGQWSIAVDEEKMIAIASITGGFHPSDNYDGFQPYRTRLGGNQSQMVCGFTGTVHAIDLHTGYTIWQMAHPLGARNEECATAEYDAYVDYASLNACERDANGDAMKDASETVPNENVIFPLLANHTLLPPPIAGSPAAIVGAVTISQQGDFVLIPSESGDIFVHNIYNGQHIHTLHCPTRERIKGGITIFEDRIVFPCGNRWTVSMQIKQ